MRRFIPAILLPVLTFAAPLTYTRHDEMIRMRDGVRLYTQVFTPTESAEKLPFVLNRTPYGVGNMDSARLHNSLAELAEEGYIFVLQDIRGRFKSEGQFVMLRQPREPGDKKAIDESTDTIEWLLKNVPNNNGRVGMAGVS
jgi:putative CocE/NonD family hydrolase